MLRNFLDLPFPSSSTDQCALFSNLQPAPETSRRNRSTTGGSLFSCFVYYQQRFFTCLMRTLAKHQENSMKQVLESVCVGLQCSQTASVQKPIMFPHSHPLTQSVLTLQRNISASTSVAYVGMCIPIIALAISNMCPPEKIQLKVLSETISGGYTYPIFLASFGMTSRQQD